MTASCECCATLDVANRTVPMNKRISPEALPNQVGPRAWRFAQFEYDLVRGELSGPAGPIALRPKADLLLRRFLAGPGCLLHRDELMDQLWPDAVVTDDSLVQCVGELRSALGDRDQRLIRTVPRRGYRFELQPAPVWHPVDRVPCESAALFAAAEPSAIDRASGAPIEAPAAAAAAADAAGAAGTAGSTSTAPTAPTAATAQSVQVKPPTGRRLGERGAVAIVAGLLCVGAVGWTALGWAPAPQPVRIDDEITAMHVFAVMPFKVANDLPGLRDTADQVADQVALQVASRHGIRTIGRGKTALLADAPLTQIARDLKATYVIQGRVAPPQSDGRGASVHLQLLAAPGGEVLGAASFELSPGAGNEAASELGQQAMNFVRGRVGQIDVAAATRPGHVPSAAELAMLGWDKVYRRVNPEITAQAREHFEQALRADPTSIIALEGLGAAHLQQRAQRVALSASQHAAGEQAIEGALRLAPTDATAALLWGNLQTLRGRPDLAIPAIEKSNRITPGFANGHLMLARALLSVGRSAEVQPEIERAARLAASMGDAPRTAAAWMLGAEAALMRHDDAMALQLARRSVAEHPGSSSGHAVLAAAEWLVGLRDEAVGEMAVYRRMAPLSTVANYDDSRPSTNAVYLAERARFYDALRQAGLPDR